VNDLTDLREGWGQPEPPSHAAYSAARVALLQQATAARAAMAQSERLTIASQTQRPARAARFRYRRTGWLAGGVGLTAAAAVAVAAVMASTSGVAPITTGSGGHAAVHPGSHPVAASQLSARQVLLAAATTAAAASAQTGAFWYLKTRGPGADAGTPQEIWYARDGSMYQLAPNGRDVYLAGAGAFEIGLSSLTYGQIQDMPTDPAALKAWITRAWERVPPDSGPYVAPRPNTATGRIPGPDIPGYVSSSLTSLLAEYPVPPALRAAAFRALASMPDVRRLPNADGDLVLAISVPKNPASKFPSGKVPAGDGVVKLIIDPATFVLRSEINFQGTMEILAAGWTDHLPKVVSVDKIFPPKPRSG
jgi:hypothetical protein